MKFNEAVIITESLECTGAIRCGSIATTGPPSPQALPEAVVDWTVQGNLAVQGKTGLFVADASYLTARNLTVGNTRPLADAAVDLGDATTAFNTVHAAQIMQTSSATTKSDIDLCPVGLDLVKSLRPVVFSRAHSSRRQYGFIAEDVYELDSCIATQQAVDYTGLLAPLVKAMQELTTRVEALEKPRRPKKAS